MFLLTEMKDVIQIKPYNFAHDFKSSLEFGLNKKFANKVVHNVGLCIVLFDIIHIGDSYILPGDGSSHTPVTFRFIVFRPFIDEVLVAKVKSCTREGVQDTVEGLSPHQHKSLLVIRIAIDSPNDLRIFQFDGNRTEELKIAFKVSLGFFDDIFIPYEYLQQKSKFVDAEQLWVWQYETEDGSHDLFMDINEEIRIRVIDEEFVDLTPEGPAPPTLDGEAKSLEIKKAPYTITASISESGLGLLSWWT